jgi:beta-lactam-binding protein with PASTA domain
MPSFIGQPLGTASRTLQDAGFKLGNVSIALVASTPPPSVAPPNLSAPPQPTPASIIVVQTPPAGQKVFAGAVVNFEVK